MSAGIQACQRGLPPDADEVFVERFRGGQVEVFDLLFQRYQVYVFNICLGILGDPDDAEDATQDTFLRAYQSLGQFRGQATFKTWLYRVAVNTTLQREKQRRRQHGKLIPDVPGPPDKEAQEREVWRQLEQADQVRIVLRELPPTYRTVLVLKYLQNLSGPEIAAVLEATVPQIKMRLFRARRAFIQRYRALFGEEDT